MFGGDALERLALRKRELLIESEANRQKLARQYRSLILPVAWANAGVNCIRAWWPLAMVAAPIMGWVLARRAKSVWHQRTKWAAVWQVLKRTYQVIGFVRQFLPKKAPLQTG